MISRLKPVMFSFALVVSDAVVATDTSKNKIKQTRQNDSSIEANTLSASELARARSWDLSAVEWRRYKELMQGIRGSISPSTISPIEVLGIHARDEAERKRYAEAWARAMREDVDRILAFQRAYDAAGKRLYPNAPLIDTEWLPAKAEKARALQASDRLLFFARPACPACDLIMRKLLQRIDEIHGIDIYLSGVAPGDNSAVRVWASAQQIDPAWVRNRRITLNHDGGALERLTNGQGAVPYILRRQGEDLSQLRVSDL